MSNTVLVGLAEKLEAIKREAEMHVVEERARDGESLYVGLWTARLSSIETCIAAMTEVDIDDVVLEWMEGYTNVVAAGDLEPDCKVSDCLLARMKENQ